MLTFIFGLKAYKLSAIWSRGRHFCVQHIGENCTTYDSGVSTTFNQETFAGNGQFEKYTYYGQIHQKLRIGYHSFELHILDVKWYQAVKGPKTVHRSIPKWVCHGGLKLLMVKLQ